MEPAPNPEVMRSLIGVVGEECRAVIRWDKRLAAESCEEMKDVDAIWDAVLGILNHGAILSQVFFPTRPRDRSQQRRVSLRAEALRKLYGVDDSESRLHHTDRDLRNAIEHIGDHVDQEHGWWQDSAGVEVIYSIRIGSVEQQPGSYALRAYNPVTNVARVGRHELALEPLVREVRRVYGEHASAGVSAGRRGGLSAS